MLKTTGSRKSHSNTIFVTSINHLWVSNGTSGLDYQYNARIFYGINAVTKREKGIGSQDTPSHIFAPFRRAM